MSVLRTGVALSLALSLLTAVLPAAAQPSPSATASPSAGSSPIAAPAHQGNTIFDYQKQLGLSDSQVKKIRAEFDAMQTRRKQNGQALRTLGQQINGLIQKQAPIPDIKAKLQQYYGMQLTMELDDIQTSRKINAIMTPDQLAKWQAIKSKARAGQPGAR
ncbi:MAG: Spy/CpxP family protein refolding chaperone [Candidatus Xenobia bacterium]